MRLNGSSPKIANIINHIGLVLDASSSMQVHQRQLVTVVDNLIKHLAVSSQGMDQETRISVWQFNFSHNIQNLIWDKDVLRTPSIAAFYKPDGMTALVDATLRSVSDLKETPERYGDHSFLLYVLTDGEENNSNHSPAALEKVLKELPGHWTTAALVPNAMAKHKAKMYGFPAGNVEVWDTTSSAGVAEVGERIRVATDNYMRGRASGVRSSNSLFSTDATTVNAQTISQHGLTPLDKNTYALVPVPTDSVIKEFVEACGFKYQVGRGFYQLMKTETIQANKDVMVVSRKDSKVYRGRDARHLVNLPDMDVRVKPDANPEYTVFVQSTSVNRKLPAGTKLLYLV